MRFFRQKRKEVETQRPPGMPGFLQRALVSFLIAPVLPWVVWWVHAQERRILREGRALSEQEHVLAVRTGVVQPHKIRVLQVDKVPLPAYDWMICLANKLGFPPVLIAGMTLRHGIYVRRDYGAHPLLIAHECVHVGQYERLNSTFVFLFRYLQECLTLGYHNSPMEQEAVDLSLKACEEISS